MAGVYPVHNLEFLVSDKGKIAEKKNDISKLIKVADMETFEVSIDGNVEEWSPMEQKGWTRRLMTGKSISISLSGKRNEGDKGNDYIASLAYKTGEDATTTMAIKFPNGEIFMMDSVVNVTSTFGGASTDVNPLEFEFQSDGQPTFFGSEGSTASRTE